MGAITYDIEILSSIPAAKIFKAVLHVDTPMPKIMPQAIKSVEILEGDSGIGIVKVIHFGDASQYKSVKHLKDHAFRTLVAIHQGDSAISEAWFDQAAEYGKQPTC